MTIRENRHRSLKDSLYRTTDQRDVLLGKLVKIEAKLVKQKRQLARLEKAMAAEAKAAPQPMPAPEPAQVIAKVEHSDGSTSNITADDLGIPAFLQRKKIGDKKDAEAKAEIEQQQAERKKNKARARIETMKAKQRGDLKKMPLTGRAALEAIRAG